MPKIITADNAQEPELTFSRDTDGTIRVSATLRGSDTRGYSRSELLSAVPSFIALSAAQKQALRDTLVAIFQDLRTLEFPP